MRPLNLFRITGRRAPWGVAKLGRRPVVDRGPDHVLTILTGKGGRTTDDSLSVDAEAALHDLERLGAFGRFWTSTVHRAFRPGLAKPGIAGVRPYDPRHSYGTAMYQVTGETMSHCENVGAP